MNLSVKASHWRVHLPAARRAGARRHSLRAPSSKEAGSKEPRCPRAPGPRGQKGLPAPSYRVWLPSYSLLTYGLANFFLYLPTQVARASLFSFGQVRSSSLRSWKGLGPPGVLPPSTHYLLGLRETFCKQGKAIAPRAYGTGRNQGGRGAWPSDCAAWSRTCSARWGHFASAQCAHLPFWLP